jgi:hypothetical protein
VGYALLIQEVMMKRKRRDVVSASYQAAKPTAVRKKGSAFTRNVYPSAMCI